MNTLILLFTAFAVSLDSFFCSFSLSIGIKNKAATINRISLTVLLMCVISAAAAITVKGEVKSLSIDFGGILLFLIGLSPLLKKEDKLLPLKTVSGGERSSYLTGFAVGLDGAASNVSLIIMGINPVLSTAAIAIFHYAFIVLGIFLSQKIKLSKEIAKTTSSFLLMLLGIYKVVSNLL